MSIMERLNETFRTVFDDETIQLSMQTTANDVDGWDSLSHVNLITAVEASFGISFSRRETFTFKSVGDLCRCIEAKLLSQG